MHALGVVRGDESIDVRYLLQYAVVLSPHSIIGRTAEVMLPVLNLSRVGANHKSPQDIPAAARFGVSPSPRHNGNGGTITFFFFSLPSLLCIII